MTLEEKVRLLVGTGMRWMGHGPVVGSADGRVPGAAGNTMNIDRVGIPGTVFSDGPAGVRIDPFRSGDSTRSFYATAWPVGTLLASSWDTALVGSVGRAFGNEVREYGVDVILGPGMNIQRNPLNGRNFEYYSEDPLVTGLIAAAMVEGIQSNGVGVSIKHFAANNQETDRNKVNEAIGERALREIYLRGFEIAVRRAQPWTVMSSYNKVNGTYTSESFDLLTTVLRDEWGFKGFVMTDWFGGSDPVAQMRAGNDVIMPGKPEQVAAILAAVHDGKLDSAVIDRNVSRVLGILARTPAFAHYAFSNHPDLRAHALLSRTAAAEGMVLLRDTLSALPVRSRRLALFGNASYSTIMGGTGSGEVHTAYTVSIAEGLSTAGYALNADVQAPYRAYLLRDRAAHPRKTITLGKPYVTPEWVPGDDLIRQAASASDAAVYTIGRNAGEGADRTVNGDFNLTDTEQVVLSKVADAFHALGKKLIVVLNIGGPIETVSWRDKADAILLVWQPGLEAGNAVADVLSGTVNPSGKLAVSFPLKYTDVPSAGCFGTPDSVAYREGIYVGYRYYTSFHVATAYPFGFGLSYTSFSFSPVVLSSATFRGRMAVTVTVTNSGHVPGREVAQLYLEAPSGAVDKPSEELKGFAKTRLLKPGESQTLAFVLEPRDLASFNAARSAWIADAGRYSVRIGASSEDIKATAGFSLASSLVVEQEHKALAPVQAIEEIRVP